MTATKPYKTGAVLYGIAAICFALVLVIQLSEDGPSWWELALSGTAALLLAGSALWCLRRALKSPPRHSA